MAEPVNFLAPEAAIIKALEKVDGLRVFGTTPHTLKQWAQYPKPNVCVEYVGSTPAGNTPKGAAFDQDWMLWYTDRVGPQDETCTVTGPRLFEVIAAVHGLKASPEFSPLYCEGSSRPVYEDGGTICHPLMFRTRFTLNKS